MPHGLLPLNLFLSPHIFFSCLTKYSTLLQGATGDERVRQPDDLFPKRVQRGNG